MPTDKPRVTATLNHQVHETISRYAELRGVSRGVVLAELVESVHPYLMQAVAILEAAKSAPEEVLGRMKQIAEQTEQQLSHLADQGLSQMDWLTGSANGRGRKTRPGGGADARDERSEARGAAAPARGKGGKRKV